MSLYNNTSLTVPEIITSKENSLVKIKIEQGEIFVIAFLIKMINQAIGSFNVTNSMNGLQVTNTAKAILKLYWNYKISHFKLCFERAKNGFYGTNFNRIDQEVVMTWLHLFSIEFDEETAAIRQAESQDHKAALKEANNEIILPVLKNVEAKLNTEKKVELPKRERTESEKKANEWMAQFDEHHFKRPIIKSGMRFIKRYGKIMEMSEFLDYKLKQFIGVERVTRKHNQLNNHPTVKDINS